MLISCNETERHCESQNTTLMQYTDEVRNIGLTSSEFPEGHEFVELMFLGIKINRQVIER